MARDQITDDDQDIINQWLKNNEITVCPPGARTSTDDIAYTHGWGKKKKKAATKKASKNEVE